MAKTVGLIFPEVVPEEVDIPEIECITDENGDVCLDKMTVTQLKRFAKDNGIDIGSAAKKDDIIQAIVAAGENTEV